MFLEQDFIWVHLARFRANSDSISYQTDPISSQIPSNSESNTLQFQASSNSKFPSSGQFQVWPFDNDEAFLTMHIIFQVNSIKKVTFKSHFRSLAHPVI